MILVGGEFKRLTGTAAFAHAEEHAFAIYPNAVGEEEQSIASRMWN
jgi:hypothetical protein